MLFEVTTANIREIEDLVKQSQLITPFCVAILSSLVISWSVQAVHDRIVLTNVYILAWSITHLQIIALIKQSAPDIHSIMLFVQITIPFMNIINNIGDHALFK